MRRVSVIVDGGDADTARWVSDRLDADAELVATPAAADVVIVAGDGHVSALDRCRQLGRGRPCVVLLADRPSLADVTAAMSAGARAVLALSDDALTVGRAVVAAAAFARPADSRPPARGRVVVVSGGHGGAGVSRLAVAIAASVPGPAALVDLDLAGGAIADLLGLAVEPSDPGLARHSSGAAAWAALRIDAGWCIAVPAPHHPELSWLVSDGVCSGLVQAAADEAETVVVDVARAIGPAVEALSDADVIVVACRPVRRSITAATRHARILAGLAPGASVRVCVVDASRRDAARLRLEQVPGGAQIALVLAPLPHPANPGRRTRRALAALAAA